MYELVWIDKEFSAINRWIRIWEKKKIRIENRNKRRNKRKKMNNHYFASQLSYVNYSLKSLYLFNVFSLA